jgi:hypothetical protein
MLTPTQINNSKPSKKPYRLFDGLGLYIEIAPNGGKYWRFKYLFLGKEKRLALGKYPEISLLEAREKRDQARKLLINNIDPSAAKAERRNAALVKVATTFELVAREWHNNHKERWIAVTEAARRNKGFRPNISYHDNIFTHHGIVVRPERLDVYIDDEKRVPQIIDSLMRIVVKRAIEQGIDLKIPEDRISGAIRPEQLRNLLSSVLKFVGVHPKNTTGPG